MTAAHHALIAQLLAIMRRVPDLTLRFGPVQPDELGEVEFEPRIVTIAEGATDEEAVTTLMHELVHLRRGPGLLGQEETEEALVREETARRLVPREALPAILGAANTGRIAAQLGVDEPTVQLRIALASLEQTEGIA
jgi:hypothetical protein